MADTNAKIVRQIEYYFGDANLPRDKFLKEVTAKTEGKWVPIETLLTFNRLKALSEDAAVIAAALSGSELVEVSEDKLKLRRNPAKPLLDESVLQRRSIYAKGFPVEGTTIDSVTAFWSAKGLLVRSVQLRRDHKRTFKGSVFVELKDEDEAKKVLADGADLDGNALLIEAKQAYLARKKAEHKAKKKGGGDKKDADEGAEAGGASAESAVPDDFLAGAVLHVSKVGADASREELKEALGAHGEVAWIDFSREDVEGYVRFTEAGKATAAAVAAKEAPITVKGNAVEIRALEGDEEQKFWIEIGKERSRQRAYKKKSKMQRGRGGGGGGNWGRNKGSAQKRKSGDRDGAASGASKKAKEGSE
eukprot:UC1_evm1s250